METNTTKAMEGVVQREGLTAPHIIKWAATTTGGVESQYGNLSPIANTLGDLMMGRTDNFSISVQVKRLKLSALVCHNCCRQLMAIAVTYDTKSLIKRDWTDISIPPKSCKLDIIHKQHVFLSTFILYKVQKSTEMIFYLGPIQIKLFLSIYIWCRIEPLLKEHIQQNVSQINSTGNYMSKLINT